jgi:hypothetical protein
MAAVDLFERALRGLTEPKRSVLASLVAHTREDLLEARSEDARIRITHEFIRTAYDLTQQTGR